jgi:hypothetical protein
MPVRCYPCPRTPVPIYPVHTPFRGDGQRPTQLAHFITPCSPQPRVSHEMEFCVRHRLPPIMLVEMTDIRPVLKLRSNDLPFRR